MEEQDEDYSKLTPKELKKRIKEAEERIRIAKMKSALYEKMIEIAEREYHIQILPPGFKK